jgi:hypothetical protein
VGPRAVLDAVMKRKISSPRRELNPRFPIAQPVAERWKRRVIDISRYMLLGLCYSEGTREGPRAHCMALLGRLEPRLA